MQPTYFSSFLLGKQGDHGAANLRDAVSLVEKWIFEDRTRKVEKPADFNALTEKTYRLAGDILVQTRYVQVGGVEYLAIRFEHSDRQRRRWRTDVVFDTKDNELRCSVGVHVGNQDGAITPLGDVASCPRIVPTLISAFGAYEQYPLLSTPMRVSSADVSLLEDLLTSPKRHIPLVLITPMNSDGTFTVNKDRVAKKLAGMAYVVYAESPEVTYAVKEVIGNEMNAYNGAVRLYWPGFKDSDSPFRHPLWLRDRAEEIERDNGGFAQFLLRTLARLSTTRVLPGVTRLEDVQRKKMLADAQAAQGEAELRELLNLYMQQSGEQKNELDDLKKQLESKQLELEERKSELKAKASECDQWRDAWSELNKSRQVSEEPVAQQFKDVSEALEKAEQLYAEKVVILGSAMRKESLHFQKPEMVFKAMQWLALDYRRSKLGEAHCSNLDISCRTDVGMFYRPHQSKNTMSRFEDDYKVVRNGKANWLKEHIGIGTGTEPNSNIRIAFYFDDSEEKVIVGFVGQHQQTTASN